MVGLPSWQTTDGREMGALVAFGSKRTLLGRRVVLTRDALGFPSDGPARIGTSVASADFDGDDFEDLALGVPFPDDGSVVAAYGSASGFSTRRTYLDDAQSGPLVAGDMNGEGIDDLAIGPNDVALHFGTDAGLAEPPDATLSAPDDANPGAFLAQFLAHGDVTGDGHAELFGAARGIPEFGDEPPQPGHVSVAFGSAQGPRDFEWVAQGMRGGPTSLAIGDVDGDRYNDLVAGVPVNDFVGEDERAPAGAVKIWWGGPESLSERPMTITQGSPGVPGTNEQNDRFGASVAVGHLDRDRYADIVVGAPGENNAARARHDHPRRAGRLRAVGQPLVRVRVARRARRASSAATGALARPSACSTSTATTGSTSRSSTAASTARTSTAVGEAA